jgi:hypothetical protein
MAHVPVLVFIVTMPLLIEHAPVAVMVGVSPEFDVAATVKADWYWAVVGAPVKVTVCAACAAVVVCVSVAAR